MKIPYFLVLLISRVRSQEVTTPSNQLQPRNHNHHPFDAVQFLKSLKTAPTKQGPVLFPNDAPPPPRPPLIVTSRPLLESIARSELGANNTEASQSQVNRRVSFLPYLARVNGYRPYIPVPSPTFAYNLVPTSVPYADIVKKSRDNTLERDNRYDDYEEQTVLPPIYQALSDHAQQNVLKFKKKHHNYYKAPVYTEPPEYARNFQNNDTNENSEYDQNQNYAFSYRVKDQKTGDDFSHSQHSSGSATNGEYRVRLPDGRMQIVSYTADENGYKADVRYDEETGTSNHNNNIKYDNKNNNIYENKNNEIYNNKNNQIYDSNNNQIYKNKNSKIYENKKNQIYDNKNNLYDYGNYVDRNNIGDAYDRNAYIERNNNYDKNIYKVKDNVDYTDRNIKADYDDEKKKLEDYYHYPDNTETSKEYYNDYSSEYNSNYEPHRSKFSTFVNNVDASNKPTVSTVKPSYEELKHLFVKGIYSTTQNYDPVELKVPSTTANPLDGTTERFVVIGTKTPNLYTNIRNSIPNDIPSYPSPRVVIATTPQNYLVSTIASLKNKVHLANKPILSDNYINKIHKYLSFN